MKQWARRTAKLHDELRELAELGDPRWWLIAGGAALRWDDATTYVASDAEPASDTFMGYIAPPPADIVADAIARAHAARRAIRTLDGELPEQPLAVTVRRTVAGAVIEPSALEVAAFAIGERCWCARLAADVGDERALARDLANVLAGRAPRLLSPLGADAVPFVTVTIGEEAIESARHGHRRGWIHDGLARGPWLGLSRAGGLAIASTCHMVVDGYGHARLLGLVERLDAEAPREPHARLWQEKASEVKGAIPLAVTWRPLSGRPPRALPLAYALGRLLHRAARRPDARFSPTFQIPVAPGAPDDPIRRRRRVVPALASVRFDGGVAEPFERFAARTRDTLAREASGSGLVCRLLAAARAAPAPLAWKRRAVAASRPRWLEPIANVIGGRGCISRISVEASVPPACAVSSPARIASPADPLGGCVVTVVDDRDRAAITLCGSGELAAAHLLDQLLGLLPD